MKPLLNGVAAEESPDKATLSIDWMPKTGLVFFVFFMVIYVFLMYSFTPKGKYDTDGFGTKLLFYLMFLGMFSPMLYVAISMWLNKTIIELSKDKVVLRYKLPYWFKRTYAIPADTAPFRRAMGKFTNKGSSYTFYYVAFDPGGKEITLHQTAQWQEADAIITYLNQNLQRLRGASASPAGSRAHG